MINGIVGKNTHRALDVNEFRAFAMVNEWAPLIFINGVDSAGGRLFSLFHEIVHLWIGENDLYNDRRYSANVKPNEVICNAVAGELIAPKTVFLEKWNSNTTSDIHEKIKELARIFRCSGSVIARRALDNKQIDQNVYDQIIEEAIEAYNQAKLEKSPVETIIELCAVNWTAFLCVHYVKV